MMKITKNNHREDMNIPCTNNVPLLSWVEKIRKLCKPNQLWWCDGSEKEYNFLCEQMVSTGTFCRLNPVTRPGCFLARTDEHDTHRPDTAAVVCCKSRAEAGLTNQWVEPEEMTAKLNNLFSGCMAGRTMYVVPFSMGPIDSPFSLIGVEITDSPYVVVSMRIVTRMGIKVLRSLGDKGKFIPCVHSVGKPLAQGEKDVSWPCNPENIIVAHFTDEDPSVWSFGSGFGGNGMLSKRSVGLRIATSLGAKNNKFLATHCSVLSFSDPEGNKHYIANGCPSGTGKKSVSLLVSTLPGWTQRCVSDEISWMNVGDDGRLYAINPERGFFGVSSGMSDFKNRSMMDAMHENTIFTNVAMTYDGDVWWEGMTKEPPSKLIDWTGKEWTPGCGRNAAHPNSRYTIPIDQCPVIDPEWDNPQGVPISAFLFAHRRAEGIPLVTEAFSWQHGVFTASIISIDDLYSREKFVPAHRDALAMTPFCGRNFVDYLRQWLDYRKYLGYSCPKIFAVNWYSEQNEQDKKSYIWPGYGNNSRVLRWICERCDGKADAVRTAIGYIPTQRSLDLGGLNIRLDSLHQLLNPKNDFWVRELGNIKAYFAKFGPNFPKELNYEVEQLDKRLHLREDQPQTHNKKLLAFVQEATRLCQPDEVRWCNGSTEEYDELCGELVKSGTFIPLNQKIRPHSYLARSDPRDIERSYSKTFICSEKKSDAGSTNNWADPQEMKKKLDSQFNGCMRGRKMYVIPFCMGPLGSPYSCHGVEITDSPYVAVNMRIMTRIGNKVLTALGDSNFLPCLHSVGCPLSPGQKDVAWPCDPDRTVIAHFPDTPSVMSFGSGYGGNALLGKKSYALRIASVLGRKEGWLAEHMLILGMTSPEGKKYYITAAFPSACGKTNLAMLVSTLPGWTVRCVGDDIAWLHRGENGRLFGINPENGFFGVAPGTNASSNVSAMATIQKNTIFTNVALTSEGDVWWEGMTKEPPAKLTDWTGKEWTPGCGRLAAHPNSRYTTPASQCPVIDPEWENPNGVPICAILFGGRRERLIPLVTEAFIWEQGVFMASNISSEQTAAAEGQLGKVRRDPFAMLPFCGYNMADYFGHWVDFRKNLGYLSPKIFYVNWFRKERGKFLWPGFGENSRVLKWICERVDGVGKARATPIGYVPANDGLDIDGLNEVSTETIHRLTHFDERGWLEEIPSIKTFYEKFGDRLPKLLSNVVSDLEYHISNSNTSPTTNSKVLKWVRDIETLCKPDNVVYCKGTQEEYDELCDLLVENGTFIRLNEELRLNSFLARTDPQDTRKEVKNNYICTENEELAGTGNNWCNPSEMKNKLKELFDGCMRGRTMYILPFCLGPLSSPYSRFGCQITDSPYVVVNMHLLAHMGAPIYAAIESSDFWPVVHSVGFPLIDQAGNEVKDIPWPCNPQKRIIAQFPQEKCVWSFGSSFGSNSLPPRVSLGLRVASAVGYEQGWLAERMAIIGITSPKNEKHYIAVAAPEGCGKTNLALLVPTIPGWTVRCISDDIAWLHVGDDNRLWAINPETGFFDGAVSKSYFTSRSAMATLKRKSIFINTALTAEGDVWWEGMTSEYPSNLLDWTGKKWDPSFKTPAAHPNARYSASISQCPVIDPDWNNPNGVPISAIVFSNRRSKILPWVYEAPTWERGVFYGATLSMEQNSATLFSPNGPNCGKDESISRHPFAIYSLCGYDIGCYIEHWLSFRKRMGYHIPKIFGVNWFRNGLKSETPSWPGFDENFRILKWIFERITNSGQATRTPLGFVPTISGLDLRGLDIPVESVAHGLEVNVKEMLVEAEDVEYYFAQFGSHIPDILLQELATLKKELLGANTH